MSDRRNGAAPAAISSITSTQRDSRPLTRRMKWNSVPLMMAVSSETAPVALGPATARPSIASGRRNHPLCSPIVPAPRYAAPPPSPRHAPSRGGRPRGAVRPRRGDAVRPRPCRRTRHRDAVVLEPGANHHRRPWSRRSRRRIRISRCAPPSSRTRPYFTALKAAAASGTLPDIIGLPPGAYTQEYRPHLLDRSTVAKALWGTDWQKHFAPALLTQARLGNPNGDQASTCCRRKPRC